MRILEKRARVLATAIFALLLLLLVIHHPTEDLQPEQAFVQTHVGIRSESRVVMQPFIGVQQFPPMPQGAPGGSAHIEASADSV